MGRFASDKGGSFQSAPVGTHVARCIKIIDIGTQTGEYQGKVLERNQIIVMFELPTTLMDDGNPFVASKFYTNSLNEKANLRHDLEQWRGRAFSKEELGSFDLMNILGKPCMVSIIEKPEVKGTKVGSVMSIPKGFQVPEQVNPSFSFWLDEYSEEKYQALSDGIKKMVQKSNEWQHLMNADPGDNHDPLETNDESEVPF